MFLESKSVHANGSQAIRPIPQTGVRESLDDLTQHISSCGSHSSLVDIELLTFSLQSIIPRAGAACGESVGYCVRGGRGFCQLSANKGSTFSRCKWDYNSTVTMITMMEGSLSLDKSYVNIYQTWTSFEWIRVITLGTGDLQGILGCPFLLPRLWIGGGGVDSIAGGCLVGLGWFGFLERSRRLFLVWLCHSLRGFSGRGSL